MATLLKFELFIGVDGQLSPKELCSTIENVVNLKLRQINNRQVADAKDNRNPLEIFNITYSVVM